MTAHCPTCRSPSSFTPKLTLNVDRPHHVDRTVYPRLLYVFGSCIRCGRGGLATVADAGGVNAARALVSFFPISVEHAPLPAGAPEDVVAEFREAEQCLAFGAPRAASALFRSALEKVLKANGYRRENDRTLRNLQLVIDAAAADGVITNARSKKAHEEVRCLGNDVLHDDWKAVSEDDVKAARHYTQRVIEDLYDDRATVEGILRAKGRLPAAP